MKKKQNGTQSPAPNAPSPRPWPLVLLAFGLLVLGFFVIGLLHARQEAVFCGAPERYLEEFLAESSAAELIEAASERLDFTVTEFEDAEALFAAYRAFLPETGVLTFTRERVTEDEAAFAVYADGVHICRAMLRPGARSFGFGQHDWTLDALSTGELSPQLESASVVLRCLAGDTLLLNGRPVGEAYLTGEGLRIADLSEVERRYDEPPCLAEYTVGPLYGSIHVTDSAGTELTPERLADGTLRYEAAPAERWTLEITAPRDVTVYVGGKALQPGDIADSGYGLLAGFAAYGERWRVDRYSFENLYREPVVTAEDAEGRELAPVVAEAGRYVFRGPSDTGTEALAAEARAFFEAYLAYVAMPGGGQYTALLRRIAPDTGLHRYVAESWDAMIWAPLTVMDFDVFRVDNVRRVGEDCFACTASYAARTESGYWDGPHTAYRETAYELIFVRQDGVWLCAAMSVL